MRPITPPLYMAVLAFVCSTQFASAKTIIVAQDGSGDVKTLKDAIAAVPDNATERTVIHLKAGTYDEGQIILPKPKVKVTFEGDVADKTIITFGYNIIEPNPQGTERKVWGIGVVIRADDFQAKNLTFQNTSGDHGQALALRIDADRAVVKDCRLLGWQDTLRVNDGRQYFNNCYIEGRVDFIYGSGTAFFENCQIHSKNGGFVTAANTPENKPFGFVFHNCKLTGDAIPWNPATTNPSTTMKPAQANKTAYLGRPWRPFASVAFIDCDLGDHISPAGWHNWDKPDSEKTARYAEYGNTGPGADTSKRVPWAKMLSKEEAEKLTVEKVLSGEDKWDPTAE